METLSAQINREGKLSVQEAAGWVLRLAQRINDTHQQGLVHGNVSGYTILTEVRTPHGKGILVDSPRQAEATFYSPERAASGQLSQGDDVWAMVVLLFFATTGQFPFQVSSAIDVARAVALGTPKAAKYGVNDAGLQSIFDRAFARDASKRLNTTPALIQAIQQWIQDPSITAIEPLEDDDEDAPTMMMQSVSVGGAKPGAPEPAAAAAPRPAAGLPAPAPLPRVSSPGDLPPFNPAGMSPRQAPTLMAARPPDAAPPAPLTPQGVLPAQALATQQLSALEPPISESPFSKGTLAAIWIVWAVVTFGGAAVEYVVLSKG